MSLWLTKYFLRNILQFSVIIHAVLSGNMLYCFLCVIAFMFIWGIKYAKSTNVFFLMISPAGLSDVSGCDV